MRLHVHSWGSGPRVVLVHGAVLGGREAWIEQKALSERWQLLAPDRPGHGRSPDARQDFEAEGPLIAEQLLDEPAHLVGHSYGGIVAMLAAELRPDAVRSLTVVEPPSTSPALGNPAVDEFATAIDAMLPADPDRPAELLALFFETAGVPLPVPDPLPHQYERGARAFATCRPPTEAQLPLAELAEAGFPILAVSGGHNAAYEAICDGIAAHTGAERAVIPGMGHLVPSTGEPFNRRLDQFLREAP